MKLLILNLLLFFYFNSDRIHCDRELKPTLTSIQQVEGANRLMDEALKEGPLNIKRAKHFPFAAYWDPATRTIGITTVDNQIYSLLFELNNASSQQTFDYYNTLAWQNQISKEDYVRAMEYTEYQNTFKTAALIEEGIRQGIFPQECRVQYAATFEEHFADQKAAGHANWHERIYETLAS